MYQFLLKIINILSHVCCGSPEIYMHMHVHCFLCLFYHLKLGSDYGMHIKKKAFISITITQHLRKIIILYYTLTTHAQGSHTVLRMSFIVAATVIFYFKL